MPKKKIERSQEEKEKLAAKIVASSDGEISIPEAMKKVGINTPTRKNNTMYRRVHRESKRLEKVFEKIEGEDEISAGSTPKPHAVVARGDNTSDFSSLSSATPMAATTPPSGLRRTLLDTESIGTAITGSTTTGKAVKRRRTSKQKHSADAEKIKRQKLESQATKLATSKIYENEKLDAKDPKRCSRLEIVRQVNAALGTTISGKSVTRMH